jgi:hypothetical protein
MGGMVKMTKKVLMPSIEAENMIIESILENDEEMLAVKAFQ